MRRSTIVLHDADDGSLDAHRVRLVLAEKGLSASVEPVDTAAFPEALLALSPNRELPVMVDRELALHGVGVIIEYVDERYPHPPLMPMDPLSRARVRLAAHRIDKDWYALLPEEGETPAARRASAERLAAALAEADEVFGAMPFFLGDAYSILDTMLAPLLWRLPHYGIVLPETATAVAAYARRMFARPAFQASLGSREKEMAS